MFPGTVTFLVEIKTGYLVASSIAGQQLFSNVFNAAGTAQRALAVNATSEVIGSISRGVADPSTGWTRFINKAAGQDSTFFVAGYYVNVRRVNMQVKGTPVLCFMIIPNFFLAFPVFPESISGWSLVIPKYFLVLATTKSGTEARSNLPPFFLSDTTAFGAALCTYITVFFLPGCLGLFRLGLWSPSKPVVLLLLDSRCFFGEKRLLYAIPVAVDKYLYRLRHVQRFLPFLERERKWEPRLCRFLLALGSAKQLIFFRGCASDSTTTRASLSFFDEAGVVLEAWTRQWK